jgi:hypothetical protein
MLCGKNIAVRDIWFGVVEISPFQDDWKLRFDMLKDGASAS